VVADRETYALVMHYLVRVVADATRAEPAEIGALDPSEPLGVPSVENMAIVARLDSDLGDIPLTLLFERPSLGEIADYLASTRAAEVSKLAGRAC
jgi:hypothetical protein